MAWFWKVFRRPVVSIFWLTRPSVAVKVSHSAQPLWNFIQPVPMNLSPTVRRIMQSSGSHSLSRE